MKKIYVVEEYREEAKYVTEEKYDCNHCAKEIINNGFCINVWERRSFLNAFIFCNSCLKHHKNYTLEKIQSREVVISVLDFVQEIPSSATPYFPIPPDYMYGRIGISVYDVHKMPESVEEDNDMTKLAGRESFEGVSIGVLSEEEKAELENYYSQKKGGGKITSPTINEIGGKENLQKPLLTGEDVKAFLLNHIKEEVKPVLEHDKKKYLENNKKMVTWECYNCHDQLQMPHEMKPFECKCGNVRDFKRLNEDK